MVVKGKPHIRPCVSIPSDGNEANEWIASIGTRCGRSTEEG